MLCDLFLLIQLAIKQGRADAGLRQAFFAQTLQLSLPSKQLQCSCAERPERHWPCWTSPSPRSLPDPARQEEPIDAALMPIKPALNTPLGKAVPWGQPPKHWKHLMERKWWTQAWALHFVVKQTGTNCWQCKVKCALDVSFLSPDSASQTNLCFCYLILGGLWQKQFKGKRISGSKPPTTIHKGLPLYCNSFI